MIRPGLCSPQRLLRAARTGAWAEAELLLRLPLSPDCREEDGSTALMNASFGGHLEVVRLLCEAGATRRRYRTTMASLP